MRTASRYHPLLAALHWTLAPLILATLAIGAFGLAGTPSSTPGKLDILELHMAGGMLILALMGVRLIVRLRTAKPEAATTGQPRLDRLAPLIHLGFYLMVLLMVLTGYVTGILAGLPAIVFARSGAPLPASFSPYPTFVAHAWLAGLLAALIALHLAGALYHQLVLKDRLLRRMGFGPRVAPPTRGVAP